MQNDRHVWVYTWNEIEDFILETLVIFFTLFVYENGKEGDRKNLLAVWVFKSKPKRDKKRKKEKALTLAADLMKGAIRQEQSEEEK